MLAAVFKAKGNLELENYPLTKLKSDEILVKINSCGVCKTDQHIFAGESYALPDTILGHEYSGIVVDMGSKVQEFDLDDHVAIDPNIVCGYCRYCREGKINLCENLKALGVNTNGGFAEYSILPYKQAYRLPKDFPLKNASFAEPLSCCIQGIKQADIQINDEVIILGAGNIGLLMLQLAKLSGASNIIVIEPVEQKRKISLDLGADHVFDSNDPQLFEKVISITNGGANKVIECVGNDSAADLAVKLSRKGAVVILFGLSPRSSTLKLNLNDLFKKELVIKGSLLNPFTFQTAVELLIAGKINPQRFEIKQVPLQQILSVFQQRESSHIVKYQIIN